MAFYDRETVDDLLLHVDLETVVRATGYHPRGTGKNRGVECPSCGKDGHHCKINTHKGLFNCFVCNFAGNAIHWLRKTKNLGFIDAVEYLAKMFNYELPKDQDFNKKIFSEKIAALTEAVNFYRNFKSDYLLTRGITQEVIDKFKIGFAPGGVLKQHLNSKGFDDELLLKVGLIRNVNGKLMDAFFNRVVIPIIRNGHVVDLYGRDTTGSANKHHYAIGKDIAFNIDSIVRVGQKVGDEVLSAEERKKIPAVIVESPINALTLLSNNYNQVIATGGAFKFTRLHVALLKEKGVEQVLIAYDTGDRSGAGQEGAIEAGELMQSEGIHSRILEFPESTDVNDLFVNGGGMKEFRDLAKKAKPLDMYKAYRFLDSLPEDVLQQYLFEKKHFRSLNKESDQVISLER